MYEKVWLSKVYRSSLKLICYCRLMASRIIYIYALFFCETVVYSHITENNWSLKSLFFLIEAPTQPNLL